MQKKISRMRTLRQATSMMVVALAAAHAATAHATNITVNTTGAPVNGKCNITDAIQAATTNKAVRGCPAGSSTNTDTITLAANATYSGYGKPLHLPSTGGAVVIQGTLSGGQRSTTIRAANYGAPSPSPLVDSQVCPFSAAIYSGGTVTIKNINLQSSDPNTTGVCLYGGSLTVDGTLIGNTDNTNVFTAGAILSHPNGGNPKRTLTMTNSFVWGNYSPWEGGGIRLIGWTVVNLSNVTVELNNTGESGGGIFWYDQGLGKMGSLTINGANFFYNDADGGAGGAIYISGSDSTASATLTSVNFQQNTAKGGGALYVSSDFPTGKVKLSGDFMQNNLSTIDQQESSLNLGAYNPVYCTNGSSVWLEDFSGNRSEWANNPPLRGDGTCVFP